MTTDMMIAKDTNGSSHHTEHSKYKRRPFKTMPFVDAFKDFKEKGGHVERKEEDQT